MTKTMLVTGALWCGAMFGQSSAPAPTFEVASIKPAPPPSGMMMRIQMGGDPGRINYQNVSLRDVMKQAYDVKDYQITGPDWLASLRWNITAKMPEDTSKAQVRLMLQSLLADRFHLELHRETKELPTYALVVAKGGPKLKVSEDQPPAGAEGRGPGGGRMMMRPGRLEGHAFTMSQLSDMLARQVGRPILDMTGLTGNYDFTLEFTPDAQQNMAMMQGLPMPMPMGGEAADKAKAEAHASEGGASLFSALQEQLGLKLESRKGPVEILVVDKVEKAPTEN